MEWKGTMFRILFRDVRTGYGRYVLLIDRETLTTVVFQGILPELPVKTPLKIKGTMENDVISMVYFEYLEENSFDQIEFLSNFTKKRGQASLFVNDANKKIFSYAATSPESKGECAVFSEKIEQLIWLRECILQHSDIPYSFFEKIKDKPQYRKNIEKQIYHIGIKEGLSLSQCDSLWKSHGTAIDTQRIQGAYRIVMNYFDTGGNTYVDLFQFLLKLQKTLINDYFREEIPVSFLLSKHPEWFVYEKNEALSNAGCYIAFDTEVRQAEKNAAQDLLRLSIKRKDNYKPFFLEEVEAETGMRFGEEQKKAISTILSTKGVKILVGGPGTGKTSTVNGVLKTYQKMHPNGIIRLCAPTGRAAQRMEETTGFESGTNHHLLEFQPFMNDLTHKDRNNPIDADLLIMDEVSMCDVRILSMILASLKEPTVLFVGDPNQLPSVGPGKVLEDMMAREDIFDVCRLTKIFRQAEGSDIVENALKIRQGNPYFTQGSGFLAFPDMDDADICKNILSFIKNKEDYQVLCPIKRGEAGVFHLNQLLQEKLNGTETKYRKYGNKILRLHDKVILNRNCPEYSYYNGDIGYIGEINSYGITVSCTKKSIYVPNENLHDVDLAYAITVHKSQGSEFPNVVIVLPEVSYAYRNLIYTAVTRAASRVVVFKGHGSWKDSVVRNNPKRNSRLLEFLNNKLQKTIENHF